MYPPLRAALNAKTTVTVAHLFAARADLSKIMRTSSGRIREKTACAINKVLTHLYFITMLLEDHSKYVESSSILWGRGAGHTAAVTDP